MKKILFGLCLYLLTFSPIYAFFTATDEVYQNINQIGTDKFSEIFDNGDGTYSYYLETAKNQGFLDFNTFNYTPPKDKYKFATGSVLLIDGLENVKVEAVSSTITNINYDKGNNKITYTLDFSNPPVDSYTIPGPFPGFNFRFPFYPVNVLKITFSLKKGMYGDIGPIKEATYSFLGKGNTNEEIVTEYYFLRGVHKDFSEKPELKKEYFSDENMTQTFSGTGTLNQPIYVKYTVKNNTKYDILMENFTDTIDLKKWYNGGDYNSGDNLSFTGLSDGGIKIVSNGEYIFTGSTTLNALSKTSDTDIIGKFIDVKKFETNIPKHSIVFGDTYLEKTGTGNLQDYARYREEKDFGNIKPLPALEGNMMKNEVNCEKDMNGKVFINVLGENKDICWIDSSYVVKTKNTGKIIDFKLEGKDIFVAQPSYKIEYYLQNSDGINYPITATKSQTLSGATDTNVDAGTKTFTGYTYEGGNTNNKQTGKILSDGSLVLKRYYKLNTYTLFFEENGGTDIADQTKIKYNTSGSENNTTPTRDGYTFGGWYTDNGLTKAFDFSTKLTADITVYAKWTKNTPTGSTGGGGGYSPTPVSPTTPTTPQPEEPKKPTKKPTWKFADPKQPKKNGYFPAPTDTLFRKYPTELPQTGVKTDWSKGTRRAGISSSQAVETNLPHWSYFKLAGSTNPNLKHWLSSVDTGERNKNMYIVLPTQGLVMPVNVVPEESKEAQKFLNGINQNFWKYLAHGAVELPDTTTNNYGEVGNKVISGHSSFFKKSSTKYKTHFQRIIEMDAGQQIWIYQKQKNGQYKRFVYKVEKSYNTSKYDISVLKPTKGKILTLFTCTPIGGISGRWIVRARYLEE